jgi:mannose-1-phosphate guanylyltransferase/mannose-6-phosphate isomerase
VRPWGDWTVLDAGSGYVVKRIRVTPGGILSLQRHRHRAEEWTVVAGVAQVTLDQRQFDLSAGQSAHIDTGDIHRIANRGTEDVVFIEVQTGLILSEDDIERLEDRYGRS